MTELRSTMKDKNNFITTNQNQKKCFCNINVQLYQLNTEKQQDKENRFLCVTDLKTLIKVPGTA